jgi:hypothetical protein
VYIKYYDFRNRNNTTISELLEGSYTYTVSNGTCTSSATTVSIVINLAITNGMVLNGLMINGQLFFAGN